MKILKWNTKTARDYVNSLSGKAGMGSAVEKAVLSIIKDVRVNGDKAVLKYTKRFDCPGMSVSAMKLKPAEAIKAYQNVDRPYLNAVDRLIKNIEDFEKKSLRRSWMKESGGVITGKYVRPLDSVGIYVPGGRASYPSSLIMCSVAARLAGVKRIVVVSPADRKGGIDANVIVAANKLSITEIYKVGGAQAVAALAYGTKTIPKVDKIVGPGSAYVAAAKRLLLGEVDIDMIAGPTEIAVLADKGASASSIAADMLSQAEHDTDAACICVTPSLSLAKEILKETDIQKTGLKRKKIIDAVLKNASIIITGNIEEATDVVNIIAAEHLQIMTKNPFGILAKIKNAGTIFLGEYSPVAIGDYAAGPSHVLPTAGTARFFSPLSVADFFKESNIISCDKRGFKRLAPVAMKFAEIEKFDAHLNSLKIRENKDKGAKKSRNRCA